MRRLQLIVPYGCALLHMLSASLAMSLFPLPSSILTHYPPTHRPSLPSSLPILPTLIPSLLSLPRFLFSLTIGVRPLTGSLQSDLWACKGYFIWI